VNAIKVDVSEDENAREDDKRTSSVSTLSLGFTKSLNSSVPCAVITHASALLVFDPLRR